MPDRGTLTSELLLLERSSLEQLMKRYPEVWASVGERLVGAAKEGPAALEGLVREAQSNAQGWTERVKKSHQNPEVLVQALPKMAAARMALLSTRQTLLAAASGQKEGTVRLGTFSGFIVQHLLFSHGLDRKPTSMSAFRFWWPLVTRKRALMPLVQARGIFCFYSRELVEALVGLIAGRPAVELAAGDGTLARFLTTAGAVTKASDDQSWSQVVSYPADVEKADAVKVLGRERPRVVLCSFPPPGNTFERRIFETDSVELYVVITTRHRFAAGDWAAYEQQRHFEWACDEALSRLVLPPHIDPAVLVFKRRSS